LKKRWLLGALLVAIAFFVAPFYYADYCARGCSARQRAVHADGGPLLWEGRIDEVRETSSGSLEIDGVPDGLYCCQLN